MSTTTERTLESYKLADKIIRQIDTTRLKKHVDSVAKLRSFFDYQYYSQYEPGYYNLKNSDPKYIAIKKYLFFISKELKSRPDFKDVMENIIKKRKKNKNKMKKKGCHHQIHSKRKKVTRK